jgi:hypothetical protein
MREILFLLLLPIFTNVSLPQSVQISGSIVDEYKRLFPYANVSLKHSFVRPFTNAIAFADNS